MPARRFTHASLAERTTLRLGGVADALWEASTEAEIAAAVRELDDGGRPLLVLGGGSNVVIADAGFRGVVVAIASRGLHVRRDRDQIVFDVQAGEPWSAVVDAALAAGAIGVECLAGIPGLAGATPIQNVGAYGQQIADTLVGLRAYDRKAQTMVELSAAACELTYRGSLFKRTDRYVVTSIRLSMKIAPRSAPVSYPELQRALGLRAGEGAPPARVAEAVLALRRSKGMVLDAADPDSVSAGSFFMNPVVDDATLARLPAEAPRFPEGARWKVPAAWLIERAGFAKGHGDGPVGISSKHALALVHRGGGTAAQLVVLARRIRDGVRARFGVTLVPEPVLVGVSLEQQA